MGTLNKVVAQREAEQVQTAQKQPTNLSRRTFLASSVTTGLFMGVGQLLSGITRAQAEEAITTGHSTFDPRKVFAPTVWFSVDTKGAVLINIAKAEMGQHVGTALARVIVEELGAEWSSVKIKHVDTDPKWGYMVTGGSWSIFTSFTQLSQAGAAGRFVMQEAGAKLLGVDVDQCKVANGMVSTGTQSISFARIVQMGDIGRSFSDEELSALPLKAPADRTMLGKEVRALDIPEKAQGEAVYGIDVELPGMVFAQALIPPTRYGSKIKSIDDRAAKKIKGYQQTIELNDPSENLQGWAMVIADNLPAAMKAVKVVNVNWSPGPTTDVDEQQLLKVGERLAADQHQGTLFVNHGDIKAAIQQAKTTKTSVYRTHTASHFTLEPMNALVEFKGGKCHIHAGNQWQSLILPTLAKALEMPESDIIIHQYYLGGGFGRRLWGDYMIPAALAAKRLNKPVKLVFNRPDDTRIDCVRSPSVQHFTAAMDTSGEVIGIDHGVAAGWPTLTLAEDFLGEGVDGNGKFDPFSISGSDHWYTLAHHRVRAINNDLAQQTFLPGYLRAVGPGWIAWGVECFMDELAHARNLDPIEFRLSLLDASGKNAGQAPESMGGAKRLAAVLKEVRKRSDWGRTLPEGEALGVAIAHGQERTMPTWTAVVTHVAVDLKNKQLKVKKIWQVIDCGTVVDLGGALAQAEGATLWGVSLAVHESNRFDKGQVSKLNLDTYQPLRMADVPELDIQFMSSTEVPTGLGEPPLIAVAPAIGNAIFAACGKRVKDLPIKL